MDELQRMFKKKLHLRNMDYNVLEQIVDPSTDIQDDMIRFVCISDTHDFLDKLIQHDKIPNGDVLIHAGDITLHGFPEHISEFNTQLGQLPHKIKLVIGGNHDLSLDRYQLVKYGSKNVPRLGLNQLDIEDFVKDETKSKHKEMKDIFTNCTYLEDNMVEVFGIKIYGSPWVIEYKGYDGFTMDKDKLADKWKQIPKNIDILITHSPPSGYGDFTHRRIHAGSEDLLNRIQQKIKPKYHIFGHIHEGYGVYSDDITTYINASISTKNYHPVNRPIVFDYPVPQGHSKSESIKILTNIPTVESKLKMFCL